MTTTRILIAAMVLCVAGCAFGATPAKGKSEPGIEQLREARRKAAHRKRRIIFNNDGNEPVYMLKEATAEELLSKRTTPLIGSQVDSIFYCTWSSGFSMFTHNTKIGEIFTKTIDPDKPDNKRGGFSRNKMAEFLAQGTDPLHIMVDFARKNGLEIFWSFRMNDTHDASRAWYGEHLFPKLKKEHPEWLVGSPDFDPPHRVWTSMNFAVPEVRDLAVAFIEEVCRNYDVDGIEMDFFRHPVYFCNPAWGANASDENLEQMTDMIRRVREVTEREGLKRGKPFLVAMRIPDSVEYCRAMGLDIERWLREGLIDMMALSGYFRLEPWRENVELGHRYGVPVYPCLSETRLSDPEAKQLRRTPDAYRARALDAWHAGVDGIYTFNAFNPRSAIFRQLGDPEGMKRLNQTYTTGARGVKSLNGWIRDGEQRFLKRRLVSPERPLRLAPGEPARIPLPVGAKPDSDAKVTLLVRLEPEEHAPLSRLAINGRELASPALEKPYLRYTVDPGAVVVGDNTIELAASPDRAKQRIVLDLALRVEYPAKASGSR